MRIWLVGFPDLATSLGGDVVAVELDGNTVDALLDWVQRTHADPAQIRLIDHYEAQGQDVATHLAWLRERRYTPDRTQIWLPHDGSTNDRVYDVSYESAFKSAGYHVEVVPNQGKGAAKARIEEVRRLFNCMWIDSEKCAGGLDALGWYHEKKDEVRNIGLGPEHDWASHGADAMQTLALGWSENMGGVSRPQNNQAMKVSFNVFG